MYDYLYCRNCDKLMFVMERTLEFYILFCPNCLEFELRRVFYKILIGGRNAKAKEKSKKKSKSVSVSRLSQVHRFNQTPHFTEKALGRKFILDSNLRRLPRKD